VWKRLLDVTVYAWTKEDWAWMAMLLAAIAVSLWIEVYIPACVFTVVLGGGAITTWRPETGRQK
jgi:hypothetical protein